ncbi:TSC complex subunit 1a isoform X2 [Oncorhynchus keta]|uniref:TSC complex subunit 1a isoform X2 n=1 Tax=Oncorhynchus keta TaxID=8018 RepID=UPI0015F9E47B|nr:TSC complex subunit 1a isoform X2 [Oncorhynchus keta]
MAKEQSNVSDLLPLLESSDLHELDQIKSVLNDHLGTERGSVLLNGLVDYYLETSSPQAILILCSVREPHDKHLLDKLNEYMAKPACRLPTLTLLGHVIRKQPPWMHKITRFPLLTSLLKCLKTDSDVVVLITGVLVLITLLPVIPQAGKQHIYDFFDIFGRLASWSLKNPGHVHGVYLIHLHASVYSLFHRLYGMYPCNFVSYLRSHYSMKENVDTFEEVVKPMLGHVRIHPELVTGTNDYELDPSRWKRFEIHDIVIECAKVSLDPKEASCEEGYSSMPDRITIHHHPHLRSGLDYTASPYTDFLSSFGSSASTPLSVGRPPLSLSLPQLPGTQSSLCSPHTSFHQNQHCEVDPAGNKVLMWSPCSDCGMTTPPTSRGISPANVPELSQSASHAPSQTASTSGGKCLSPAPTLSNEFEHLCSPPNTTNQLKQKPSGEAERGNPEVISKGAAGESVKTMSLTELSDFIKEQDLDIQRMENEHDEDAITEELLKLTEQKHKVDYSFYSTTETLTGPQEKEMLLTTSNQSLNREAPCLVSTPDKSECSAGGGDQQLPWSFRPCFTPIDNLLTGFSTSQSPYRAEEEGGSGLANYGLFSSPSIFRDPVNPVYEPLFELALPRAASLFVGRKTSVALAQRAAGDEGERNASKGEEEGDEMAAMSPLEVLDRLIQHGNEAYEKVLKRLPMPDKSVDWTHFGGKQQSMKAKGTTPLDELHTLRSQVLLLHNQLLYERYKREQHAIRNRRLLRRIINATAMEEQNNSMKAQLKLQDIEIQSLQASLVEEQQRYRRLKEDGDTETACLHSQFQQLQQGHDLYLSKAQKLQSELQECQSNMGELEAELQKANNEAYNTGHQLTQLSLKLTNSENLQQQMYLLNKQLLLLGETNKLAIQEVQRLGPESSKGLQMLQSSMGKEQECLRQSMLQQTQGLEAAQQRIGDLEAQLAKKEHLILEQKLFLEEVKGQTKGQLQASESRYLAMRRVTQVLQTEMLQLYSQLDAEMLTTNQSLSESDTIEPSSAPPGTSRPNGSSSRTVPTAQGSSDRRTQAWPPGNGGTLPPGGGAQFTTSVTLNGSLKQPPLLSEMSPTHLAAFTLSLSPAGTPFTVGTYPSAKSFLGMHARELFCNKSDGQCDGDEDTQLSSLSHSLVGGEESSESTENVQSSPFPPPATGTPPHSPAAAPPSQGSAQSALAQEPPPSDSQQLRAHHGQGARPRASAAAAARQRRKDLRIMDYNETQQEHI